MNTDTTINKSGSFIVSQLAFLRQRAVAGSMPFGPAITISQLTGSGAHEIAELAAGMFQQTEPNRMEPWQVFDRQLVEKALEEHHLPMRFARHMPEDRRSYVQDVADEFFGLRPPAWVLVPKVAETILHLAKDGHVILVGRGATVVTAQLPGVFHVRLVAPLPQRLERVQQVQHLSRQEAVRFIEKEDLGSRRYAKANFHARIEDDLLYHLVINTGRVSYADAATLIVNAARQCFRDAEHLRDARHNPSSATGPDSDFLHHVSQP